MAEISRVDKGVSFTDSLKNCLGKENVSLCHFLFFLDIADIVQYVENNFYSDKDWHFRYDVAGMIKLAVVKFFRQQPYKKLVISEEEAWYPGFKEKDGKILIPSGGTLHHFVKYRPGVEGIPKSWKWSAKRLLNLLIQRMQN